MHKTEFPKIIFLVTLCIKTTQCGLELNINVTTDINALKETDLEGDHDSKTTLSNQNSSYLFVSDQNRTGNQPFISKPQIFLGNQNFNASGQSKNLTLDSQIQSKKKYLKELLSITGAFSITTDNAQNVNDILRGSLRPAIYFLLRENDREYLLALLKRKINKEYLITEEETKLVSMLINFVTDEDKLIFLIEKLQIDCTTFIKLNLLKNSEIIYNLSGKWFPLMESKRSDFSVTLLECLRANPVDPAIQPRIYGGPTYKIEIKYWFTLETLVSLTSDGDLTFTAWFELSWSDPRRLWTLQDPRLPKLATISSNEIWYPVFELARCTSESCFLKPNNVSGIELRNYGRAEYVTKTIFTTNCDMDLSNFPFDSHNCSIKFLSKFDILVIKASSTISFIQFGSDEWKITSIEDEARIFTFSYKMEENKQLSIDYSGFEINILVCRVPGYYIQNLIIPVLVVSGLGFITVLLPADSSDKLNLAVTVLLGFLFLQTIISGLIPKSAGSPFVSIYLVFSLLLSAYNVVINGIILGISNITKPKFPPNWIQFIVKTLYNFAHCHYLKKKLFSKKRSPQNINFHYTFSQVQISEESRRRRSLESNANMKMNAKLVEENDNKKIGWKKLSSLLNWLGSASYAIGSITIFIVYLKPLLELGWKETKEHD